MGLTRLWALQIHKSLQNMDLHASLLQVHIQNTVTDGGKHQFLSVLHGNHIHIIGAKLRPGIHLLREPQPYGCIEHAGFLFK